MDLQDSCGCCIYCSYNSISYSSCSSARSHSSRPAGDLVPLSEGCTEPVSAYSFSVALKCKIGLIL